MGHCTYSYYISRGDPDFVLMDPLSINNFLGQLYNYKKTLVSKI